MAGSEARLLSLLAAGPCSSEALAREFGLTRGGVWKRVQSLRAAGVDVIAERGRGYRLAAPLQLLDAGEIGRHLSPVTQAQLAGLEVEWTVESTNAELLSRPPPAHGTVVLLAERQRAGRGRRGRPWVSPLAANLYLSLSRCFDAPVARLGGLSLAVGVAVAEALAECGVAEVGLKWPNDLHLNCRKLGGVLIELGGELGGPLHAVVGIGVNVRMPAAAHGDIDQPWTDLAAAGAPTDRNRLVATLLRHLLDALAVFDAQGLGPFRERYAGFDRLAGEEVVVLAQGRRRFGTALGIHPDGGLRVDFHEGGGQVVHAGEVSLRLAEGT